MVGYEGDPEALEEGCAADLENPGPGFEVDPVVLLEGYGAALWAHAEGFGHGP